jgi:3-methyladenine DNA glycosylase Tag
MRTYLTIFKLKIALGGERLSEGSWHPPKWIYRDRRPASDDVYFENMTRVIFLAGLSWKMIDEKWPNFKKAFNNFSIVAAAKFDEKDIKRLMGDVSIVRNQAKIIATINNAKQLQNIKKEHGSFQSYLDKLDKSKNYASAIKKLGKKFSRLGPSSARIFLYSVGEKIERPQE